MKDGNGIVFLMRQSQNRWKSDGGIGQGIGLLKISVPLNEAVFMN